MRASYKTTVSYCNTLTHTEQTVLLHSSFTLQLYTAYGYSSLCVN